MHAFRSLIVRRAPLLALIIVCVLLTSVTALAQTATPVPPTATSAVFQLEIDTNQMFSQANVWIGNFLPIFAITIGITIALSILTYFSGIFGKLFSGGTFGAVYSSSGSYRVGPKGKSGRSGKLRRVR